MWARRALGFNFVGNVEEPRTPGRYGQWDDLRPIDADNPTCETVHWSVSALTEQLDPKTERMVYGETTNPLLEFGYKMVEGVDGWHLPRNITTPGDAPLVLEDESPTHYELEILQAHQQMVHDTKGILRFFQGSLSIRH
jgi:hypothetical protein